MGTFGNYYGPAIIKEDRIDAFTLGISKILFYGGMMHLRNVEMYGKQILLLDPVVLKKGEDVDFTYNYFEERSWENAGYESNNHIFYSDKIGSHEFNLVITAVYCLYELFDEGRGFAMVNGDIVQNPMYIGWINHLLKTEYTFAKRYDIWANVEEYAVERRDYDRPFSQSDLFDIVPKYLIKYAGGTELADVLYVIFGTETLEAADVIEGTYPFDILKCKNAIKRAIDFYGKKKAYDYISEIARMNSEGRRSIVNKYLNSIAECSLYMPARVLVYLMCELLGKSFWKEWAEFRSDIYKDEVVKKYAPEELEKYREEGRIKPINSITTSEFLKNDEPFIFMDTPKELQDEPDYYVSDADRLYWWDDSDEVLIDEKTKEWISEIVDEYKDALKEEADSFDSQMFVKEIIELLYEINERYKRVFAFQDMFYEFIANGTKKEYHAAIKVLRKQYDKNAKTAEVVAKAGGWNLNNKNVTCNKGRMNMKRYLSLLANKKLRKKYLYF